MDQANLHTTQERVHASAVGRQVAQPPNNLRVGGDRGLEHTHIRITVQRLDSLGLHSRASLLVKSNSTVCLQWCGLLMHCSLPFATQRSGAVHNRAASKVYLGCLGSDNEAPAGAHAADILAKGLASRQAAGTSPVDSDGQCHGDQTGMYVLVLRQLGW